MSNGNLRGHRAGQPKTRSHVAVNAHMRSSAGPMGKRGAGRSKDDNRSRQSVKVALHGGDW